MNEKQTAKLAEKILLKNGKSYQILSKTEKTNLAIALARKDMVIYGNAYDIVKTTKKVDFTNENEILKNLDNITIYEIKSTNRKDMKKDFGGYFFDLTTAELLVAQNLKNRFRFVFVNTITENILEMTVNQVFAKAKRIYPKWAITF